MTVQSRTADWFEVKVRYEKTLDNGLRKKVTEAFAIDALTFTEAESRITKVLPEFIDGEFRIQDISRAAYHEFVSSYGAGGTRYYKTKVNYINVDEKTGKEKRSSNYFLVQASYIDKAKALIDELLQPSLLDYEVASVVETPILDVFIYNGKDNGNAKAYAVKEDTGEGTLKETTQAK